MSEEINKILDKFDRTLEEYELDKKVGQISIDSIYFLYPSEMITIKNYIRQNENIIKEVRERLEYLLNNDKVEINGKIYIKQEADNIITKYILEILDKVKE